MPEPSSAQIHQLPVRSPEEQPRLTRFRRAPVLLALVVAITIAIVAVAGLGGGRSPSPQPRARSTWTWRFGLGIPSDWVRVKPLPRAVANGSDLDMRTTRGTDQYQLISPQLALPPGSYDLGVAGRLLDGGLAFGSLDRRRDRWIHSEFIRAPSALGALALSFTLHRSTQVEVILTNASQRPASSHWIIRSISLRRR